MIEVGMEAPDFKLYSQFGTEYSVGQFKGHKNVMMVFYPLEWTPT
jgi:peroxiredoxin (alkyl hydroperoxide reductase subunit C)